MKNIVNSYVKKFTEEHRKTRKAVALLLALAMVVATGVSWQLHATGIALTNETYCGLEEHTHSADCYEEVLTCGLEESEGHTHTEDCYKTKTVLVCGKEESEGHTHTEDCYDADGSLICGQEESEGHTHSDSCYETETTLVCGKEESEGHTHSDACYEEQLVCGLEEHTHTVDCLTDVTADVETAADWEATLPELTGDWAADLVAVAQSQLGYAESTANFTLADDGTTRQGYTRYGAWYGNAYGAWDAMFVSFCLSYAGIPEESMPQAAGAYAWTATLSGFDCYTTDGDYTPAAGDIAFFDADGDGAADGVGIVSNVSGTNMTVVQGDSGDQVAQKVYAVSEAAAFVDMTAAAEAAGTAEAEEADAEAEEADESEAEAEATTYTASADGVTVTVTAPVGALPENVELIITMLDEDSDAYTEAAEAVGYDAEDEDTGMAAMDISFYDGDGLEVEPTAPVSVSIDASALLPEEADAETIEVQHLTETESGVEATLVADADNGVDTDNATVEFEVESFSTFTITWSSGTGFNAASTSITATTYLYGTNNTIGSGSTTLTGTSGTAFDLTSSNSSLAIDGYTLVSASVTYGETTYTDVTAVTVSATENWGNKSYSYFYTDSSGSHSLYSGSNTQTVTISLYYTENAGITISAAGDDTNGYTLSATTAGSYTYSDKKWSISDTSVAALTDNGDGTVTVKWTDAAESGDTVTVTVSSTYVDSDGVTQTVTDSYTLTNGLIEATITVYWGTNSTTVRSGASVSLYDSDGNFVTSGTTDSNGQVTFTVLPGETYTVVASYTSNNTGYGNGNGDEFTFTATETTASVYINTSTGYNIANHVDLEVTGSFDLTINGEKLSFTTYVYSSSISVTTPDGTNIGSDGTLQSSNVTGYDYEYRISASVSMQWDSDDGVALFSLDGYVLVSQEDVQKYIDSGVLTEAEVAAIFGEAAYYNAVTSGNDTIVPAGYYYKITFNDYHPDENVCAGGGNSKGYDFILDIDEALSYLEDMLTVSKYVVDESGNVIDDTTDFTFTLEGADSNTSSYSESTQLSSGESDTFEDLTAGYYKVTESSSTGYIPVTVTANSNGTYTIAESGYVQYAQSTDKEEGAIASVTFYNLKLSTLGVVKLQKEVDGDASSTYSNNTFTFYLYTGNDTDGYDLVSNLGAITVTTSESSEFYLKAGTYTIVELGSDLANGDSQTVTINDTELKKEVAEEGNAYGLTAGTVYYVGTIEVEAGKSLTYTATNTYSSSVDLTLKKVDYDDSGIALAGAEFTLNDKTYTTDENGLISIDGLTDGVYTLTETAAPDGYNLLTYDITITVSNGNVNVSYTGNTDSVTYVSYDSSNATITVKNKAGYELPSTGGSGTWLYTLTGLTLCGAALVLWKRKETV